MIIKKCCYLAASVLLAACSESGKFVIEGSISPEFNGSKVYLQTLNDDIEFHSIDSSVVSDGAFKFKGQVVSPKLASIVVATQGASPLSFVLENADIKAIVGTPATISGTPANDSLQQYYNFIYNQTVEMKQLVDTYQSKQKDQTLTPEDESDLMSKYEALESGIQKYSQSFIGLNSQSLAGAYVLYRSLNDIAPTEVETLVSKMSSQTQNSPLVRRINDYLSSLKNSEVGAEYTNLTMPDLQGNMVYLSDYVGKGKYVLVDFWASWCGPCRREMPNVLAAYKKFASKGFEVVGVSFDDNKEAWQNGVTQLGITWPQMSDLKGWKSQAADVYGIRSIPSTLLIDPQGKIIAKDLRGEELEKTLERYLK